MNGTRFTSETIVSATEAETKLQIVANKNGDRFARCSAHRGCDLYTVEITISELFALVDSAITKPEFIT